MRRSLTLTLTQLGQFVKADEKLQKLVALRPTDVEAVRLLVSASLCRLQLKPAGVAHDGSFWSLPEPATVAQLEFRPMELRGAA